MPATTHTGLTYVARAIVSVARKELRQTFRDRRMAAILFVAPVIQLTLLGFAVDLDVDHVATVVVDRDRTAASRALLDEMLADATLDRALDAEDPTDALTTGRAKVAVIVPRGFARDRLRGRPVQIQALIDGTDPVESQSAVAAVQEFLQRRSLSLLTETLDAQRAAGRPVDRPASVVIEPRILYNPS